MAGMRDTMRDASATFETRRNEVLTRLEDLVRKDTRLVALWLQGSLADGTADPLSDIDAFLAVEDAAFDAVYAARLEIVAGLGTILAWSDATTPGLRAVHCLLDGPVKLDLFFEPLSTVGDRARPAARVLLDKSDVGTRLRTDWRAPVPDIARIIEVIVRMTRQGAAWPVRLMHRGQWSTMAMMTLDLINAQIAQLMVVQSDPGNYYKNQFTLYRHLRPDQQLEIDTLTRDALSALDARDQPALRAVYLRVFDAMVRESRAACASLGIAYPQEEAGDASIRAFLESEWPDGTGEVALSADPIH
jgi:predicted nucleotidyltransferase